MKSRVTTGKGDDGATRTLAGERVAKSHPILEATGDLDSLRAHIALIRLHILEEQVADAEEHGDFLFWLLHVCFLIGTEVNDPERIHPEYRAAELTTKELQRIESFQEKLEGELNLPKAFIASAATRLAAEVDLAATVARRLERSLVRLKEAVPEFETAIIVPFVNRISDFLYVLARVLEAGDHSAVDYSVIQDEG